LDFKNKKVYRTEVSDSQWEYAEKQAPKDLRYSLIYELLCRIEALERAAGTQDCTYEVRLPSGGKGARGIDLTVDHDADLTDGGLVLGEVVKGWMAQHRVVDGKTRISMATGTPCDLPDGAVLGTITYKQLAGFEAPTIKVSRIIVNEHEIGEEAEPVVEEPVTKEPVVEEPTVEEPVVEEPGPVIEDPVTEETGA